ncbi:MAG: metallophosphoesterase [Clostridia bacterium]|nr:metallophosphoesterase [Clostridia bacterium]
MNRIFVCGDTHGTLDAKKIERLCKDKILDYKDYIIICGDAGIVWSDDVTENHITFYEKLNTNILFIDGNHENFDKLKRYPMEMWNGGLTHKISTHIHFLLRGQIFDIMGRKILTIGGADSHDRKDRINHVSWWWEESISDYHIELALQNLTKVNNRVDYIITHTPCEYFANELYQLFTQCGEQFPPYLQKKMDCNQSGIKLNQIADVASYKKWFCGHWHIDEQIDNFVVLYNSIIEI